MNIRFRRFGIAALLLFGMIAGAAAQTKLLFSTFFPPGHPLYRQVLQPWAAAVQEATQGNTGGCL
jgi:TRAP-type C4-dicarboxylate transport system, periplasmic component